MKKLHFRSTRNSIKSDKKKLKMVKKDKKEGKKAPRKTLYDDYVDKILPDLSRKVILITGIDDEVVKDLFFVFSS